MVLAVTAQLAIDMNEIKNLQIQGHYINKKTNGLYRTVGFCRMKDEMTGVWYDAVRYVNATNNDGIEYVRSVKSFTEKFKDA